jgi:hypothetical protein
VCLRVLIADTSIPQHSSAVETPLNARAFQRVRESISPPESSTNSLSLPSSRSATPWRPLGGTRAAVLASKQPASTPLFGHIASPPECSPSVDDAHTVKVEDPGVPLSATRSSRPTDSSQQASSEEENTGGNPNVSVRGNSDGYESEWGHEERFARQRQNRADRERDRERERERERERDRERDRELGRRERDRERDRELGRRVRESAERRLREGWAQQSEGEEDGETSGSEYNPNANAGRGRARRRSKSCQRGLRPPPNANYAARMAADDPSFYNPALEGGGDDGMGGNANGGAEIANGGAEIANGGAEIANGGAMHGNVGVLAYGQSGYQAYATPQLKPLKKGLLKEIICMAGKALRFLDDPAAQSWSATVLGNTDKDTTTPSDYSLGGYMERIRVARNRTAGSSFEEITALIGLTVKAGICAQRR